MKLKNEQEIESLGYKIQGHPVTNHAFTQGYMQAQQDLLSQASEGFDFKTGCPGHPIKEVENEA